jgi:hypothetical protein
LAAKVKANGSEELSSPLRKLIKSKFAVICKFKYLKI